MMSSLQERAQLFHSLHVRGTPLVLCNVWDAGSAKAVAAAGAHAIATSSWAVAAAQGCADGEQLPMDLVLANASRIVQTTPLPVSIDIESGYGASAGEVANTVRSLLDLGAVGCNIEDRMPGNGRLLTITRQVERLRAARAVADGTDVRLFINARTDVFLETPAEQHSRALIAVALERAKAYAEAGADGLFVPGLKDPELVRELCDGSPLPVNVMLNDLQAGLSQWLAAGVARLSYGPAPYLHAMQALGEQASRTLQTTTST
jgi:2-methylisocitrate lyase-like PEP mutase family enzyme